jgi:hypothetical protein
MKGSITSLLLIIFLIFGNYYRAQTIWTVGPMLHVNFGGEKVRASWALEFAYWNFSHFPYSIDFATEFEKKKIRLYGELQTGIGIAGTSIGPVVEFQTDKPATKLGLQMSIWGNYYWGFDVRYRYIDKKSFLCPGTYLKGGFAARDENGNKIKSSSSSSHFHEHH